MSKDRPSRSPSAARATGTPTRELPKIEALCFEFHEAFHLRDIEKMERLWSHSPHARCVHPMWGPIVGWGDIRQSWVEIFRTIESVEFQLEDVHVEVSGALAWLNATVHADMTTDEGENLRFEFVTTMILERFGESEWKIVLYHGSHIIDDEELEEAEPEVPPGEGGKLN